MTAADNFCLVVVGGSILIYVAVGARIMWRGFGRCSAAPGANPMTFYRGQQVVCITDYRLPNCPSRAVSIGSPRFLRIRM
jgi:hypothetical protein